MTTLRQDGSARWTEQVPECCPDGCKLSDTRTPEQVRDLGKTSMLECMATVIGETGDGSFVGMMCLKAYDHGPRRVALDIPRIERLIVMLERMRDRLRKTS